MDIKQDQQKFFEKKIGSGAKASFNEKIAQKLHKSVIKKFGRREADLAEMGSMR